MKTKFDLNPITGQLDAYKELTDTDNIKVNSIQLNTSYATLAHTDGLIHYDTTFHTAAVDIGTDVTVQIGQETMCYVYNETGSDIVAGKVVYINGATTEGIPKVALAQANSEATSFALGVVTSATISNNGYGYATIRGHVNDLNTSAFTVGDSLYLSATSAGDLTTTPPSEGNYDVRVGRVMIKDASTGRVYVNIRPMSKLTDLGDVTIATPTTDQVLRYNGTEWVNGAAVSSSASPGIEFFPDDTSITAAGTENAYPIKTLSKIPVTTAENVDSIACASSTVMHGTYLYDTALGRTTIDAGVWLFSIYAAVSSSAGTTTLKQNINRVRPGTGTVTTTGTGTTRTATASTGAPFAAAAIDVGGTVDSDSYLQTTTGYFRILSRVSDTEITIETLSTYSNQSNVAYSVHKRLFQITTPELNNTATAPLYAGLQLYEVSSVQGAYTVQTTDKLATSFFGTSTGNHTVYFSHNGTTRYTHFETPLITLHGNLAGLQGGTGSVPSEEYYHLTAAQYTIATSAVTTVSSGYMTYTMYTALLGKEDVSNKSTATTLGASDTLYPSQKAVKTYVDAKIVSSGSALQMVAVVSSINLAAAGTVSIYDVPTGKTFLPHHVVLERTAVTSFTTGGTFYLGSNEYDYDDFNTSGLFLTSTGLVGDMSITNPKSGDGDWYGVVYTQSSSLKFLVATPDDAGASEATLYLFGYITPVSLDAGTGDVVGPATNTADYVPQWDGTNSKTLKNGLAVGTVASGLAQYDANIVLPASNMSYVQASIAAAAIDWNINTHYKALSAATTLTFSNAADGKAVDVLITTTGTCAVTWPTVKWPGAASPTQSPDGTDLYSFKQINGTIYGVQAIGMA